MDGIYCMVNSGKPLTEAQYDVLMFNAVDMFEEGRKVQRIKGRDYDGVIESNLEIQEIFGNKVVAFEALMSSSLWESNDIQFIVNIEDLDGIHLNKGKWSRIMAHVMGIRVPPEIIQKIKDGDPEVMEQLKEKLREAMGDDEENWETGEPTYG